MATDDIKIVVTADDKASGVLGNIGKAAGSLGGVLGGLAKVAGVAAIAGIGAMVVAAHSSINAFVEAERATRQLNHAVLDISKGTKEQVAEINNLSQALQRKAGIDGDALKAGVAQLSTFGLQTSSVIGLTKSLADLTVNQDGLTASADSYISNANIMAKALNGQFGVLAKMGIRFTEAQQATINFGTEQEKVAAIVEGFNQNLRETTDSIATSYEAKVAILTQSFGELQESIGKVLVTAFQPFVTQFAEWASSEDVQNKFSEIAVTIGEMVAWLIKAIATVWGFGKTVVQVGKDLMERFKPAFDIVMTVFQTVVIPVFKELWNIVKNQLWPSFVELYNALLPFIPLLTMFAKVMGVVLLGAITVILVALASLIAIVANVLTDLAKLNTFIANSVLKEWKSLEDKIIGVYNAFKKIVDIAKQAKDAVSGFNVGSAAGGLVKKITGKATGGSVSASTPYIVGEKGAELFVPNRSGSIVPNGKLAGAGGGGINISVTGTFLSETAAMQMAEIITDKLKLELRI